MKKLSISFLFVVCFIFTLFFQLFYRQNFFMVHFCTSALSFHEPTEQIFDVVVTEIWALVFEVSK